MHGWFYSIYKGFIMILTGVTSQLPIVLVRKESYWATDIPAALLMLLIKFCRCGSPEAE